MEGRNAAEFYLARVEVVYAEFEAKNYEKCYRLCNEQLFDSRLPLYWRGHFNLVLASNRSENPVGHAKDALSTFEGLLTQSPGHEIFTRDVSLAQKILAEVLADEAKKEKDSAEEKVEGKQPEGKEAGHKHGTMVEIDMDNIEEQIAEIRTTRPVPLGGPTTRQPKDRSARDMHAYVEQLKARRSKRMSDKVVEDEGAKHTIEEAEEVSKWGEGGSYRFASVGLEREVDENHKSKSVAASFQNLSAQPISKISPSISSISNTSPKNVSADTTLLTSYLSTSEQENLTSQDTARPLVASTPMPFRPKRLEHLTESTPTSTHSLKKEKSHFAD